MLFQCWASALGGGPILKQHGSSPRVCWASRNAPSQPLHCGNRL